MAAAPVLQQFFPRATRHSLLGPPPVGVSLKPARLAFPGLPFQRQNRTFRKDFPRIPERKREADPALSSSLSQGQGADEGVPLQEPTVAQEESEQLSLSPSETPTEASPDGEPTPKRLKSGDEDSVPDDAACVQQVQESSTQSHEEKADPEKANEAADASIEKTLSEELKTSEVVSTAGLLKVTIQQSSESRAISTMALKPTHWTSEMGTAETSPESALRFYCYICKTNCCNQQNFQAHMAGLQHQQRLQKIQHMSNLCFVSLLPMVKEQRLLAEKDGESQPRWCNTCQINFTGDLIKHRRTQEHKLAKRSLRPFCTVCSRHFKTPRKFVEHMKSQDHKEKAKEVRLGEKEQGGPEDSEELITVDAIGCFEDDDEEEEDDDEEEVGEEEDSEVGLLNDESSTGKQVGSKEGSSEDTKGSEKYCPDTIYGPDFLVPVAGFLCRLCHKFYHSDSVARLTHCKSLMHFENFQRYKATRLQAASTVPEVVLRPQQEPHDLQNFPAAKRDDPVERADGGRAGGVQDATVSLDARKEEDISVVQRNHPSTIETDDPRGTQVTEDVVGDKTSFSIIGDNSLGEDAVGLCAQTEDPINEPTQEGTGERVRVGEENPSGQGQEEAAELSSLDKGEEASASRRRSTRRRAR